MSASLRAGASFVPSPVTATTCPFSFKHCTIRSLSNGEDLAITWILSMRAIRSSAALTPGLHGSFNPTSPKKIFISKSSAAQESIAFSVGLPEISGVVVID